MLSDDVHVLERRQDVVADIKVAAYCRVSTDMEIQKKSLDTQIAAFNKVIEEHPGWVLAGIYADKGISGTTVRHREEFKRMIEDAKAGKMPGSSSFTKRITTRPLWIAGPMRWPR